MASTEVPDDVKDLAMDLCPWPLSNEEAWAIIDDHLAPTRRTMKLLRETIRHQSRIIEYYEKGKENGTL
jgi:hypothetical protein